MAIQWHSQDGPVAKCYNHKHIERAHVQTQPIPSCALYCPQVLLNIFVRILPLIMRLKVLVHDSEMFESLYNHLHHVHVPTHQKCNSSEKRLWIAVRSLCYSTNSTCTITTQPVSDRENISRRRQTYICWGQVIMLMSHKLEYYNCLLFQHSSSNIIPNIMHILASPFNLVIVIYIHMLTSVLCIIAII